MVAVRRLVIDVLKPHEPELVDFAERLARTDGVEALSTSLVETDREVQNVKITFEGKALDVERIEAAVEQQGGSVHSIDEVACGEYVVEDRPTPQD